MMVGLQGAGKTTHSGKIAGLYKKQGKNPLLVACDVYRPASIKQLQIVGEKLSIPVYADLEVANMKNFVVGANEKEAGTVSLRARGGINLGAMTIDEMLLKLTEEIETKAR
jgi:signal recognition particle subunit SRP54